MKNYPILLVLCLALSTFIACNESENDALTPYYLMKIGMLHEKEGRMSEAKSVYEQIKAKYPESAAGRDIDKNIIKVSQG